MSLHLSMNSSWSRHGSRLLYVFEVRHNEQPHPLWAVFLTSHCNHKQNLHLVTFFAQLDIHLTDRERLTSYNDRNDREVTNTMSFWQRTCVIADLCNIIGWMGKVWLFCKLDIEICICIALCISKGCVLYTNNERKKLPWKFFFSPAFLRGCFWIAKNVGIFFSSSPSNPDCALSGR